MAEPVDNVMVVQILQSKHNARSIEDTPCLGEHIVVNVHHEVTTARVLHHKTDIILQRTQFTSPPTLGQLLLRRHDLMAL